MIYTISQLNLLSIILASAGYFILGGIWFSPFMFGKLWENAIGFNKPPQWRPGVKYYLGPAIGCFLATLVTAMLVSALDVQTYLDAGILGFMVGTGYAASISMVNSITPITPHPLLQGLITGSYHVLGIVIAALILVSLN